MLKTWPAYKIKYFFEKDEAYHFYIPIDNDWIVSDLFEWIDNNQNVFVGDTYLTSGEDYEVAIHGLIKKEYAMEFKLIWG